MSLERKRNSPFTYEELPLKSKSLHPTTRMIRLLPNADKNAEIECELFIYDLTSGSGADSHLYEALSYVWGSNRRSRTIKLNSCAFPVTENLHLALLHLRNRQLERILWVDAICINQYCLDEKTEQIPLMRTIYAQAHHVTVWLGEAYEDGDKALEGLRCLAEGQDITTEGCENLCVNLFRRAWFRRIWVLQEAGVARFIYIMCGSVQINGHALCEGLKRLGLPSRYQEMIGPVAFLIKGALLRPKYEPGSRGTLTIGELVGMYCYHDATEQHDKIYALLGLSADSTTPDLTPNYALPWNKVFKQVTNLIFPECSVETWPGSDLAIIRGNGWALGHICSVRHVSDFGQQKVRVYLNDTARSMGYESEWDVDWELQTFAQFFSPGDIVFLLQGASKPSIIRLCKDHFRIITPAVTICKRRHEETSEEAANGWNTPGRSFDILLAWRFPLNDDTGFQYWPERELLEMAPAYQEQCSEAENRRNIITQIMTGIVIEALALKSEHDDIALLLGSSGTDIPIASKLAKASAKDIRHSSDRISQDFFQSEQGGLLISEGMLKVVAENNGPCGYIIMELLFQLQGGSLPISEGLFEAAARNPGEYGHQVMETLYRHRGESFPISEEIVKAAAGNTGKGGAKILKTLFKAQGKTIPISEEVIKVAAENTGNCGSEILKLIVQYRGKDLLVSKEVYKTAFANDRWGYENIVHYFFPYWEKKIPIPEELAKAAAETRSWEDMIMNLIIRQGEKSLPISEEMMKIAARHANGYQVLQALYKDANQTLPISEEVVKAAAENSFSGDGIMEILFQHTDGSLPISEEVVKAAAGNSFSGKWIMEVLFRHADAGLPISEEVVKAAAGNEGSGDKVMELLFQQEGERLPVTEEVVKTAAGNKNLGVRIVEYLLQQKGRSGLPVTEEVLKAAAENYTCGARIMEIVHQETSLQTTVPKSSERPESLEGWLSSDGSDEED